MPSVQTLQLSSISVLSAGYSYFTFSETIYHLPLFNHIYAALNNHCRYIILTVETATVIFDIYTDGSTQNIVSCTQSSIGMAIDIVIKNCYLLFCILKLLLFVLDILHGHTRPGLSKGYRGQNHGHWLEPSSP